MPNTRPRKQISKPANDALLGRVEAENTLAVQTKQILIGLLSRAQVAQRLGVCPHTVQRLTRRGLLPAIVFNSRFIRYSPEVVEAFIESAIVGKGVQ